MPRLLCHRRLWKALLLCVTLAALAVVATAAVLPAHWHPATRAVNCNICYLVHSPALQSPVNVDTEPLAVVKGPVATERLAGLLETIFFGEHGRAPPA